jgi:hypothetical protein
MRIWVVPNGVDSIVADLFGATGGLYSLDLNHVDYGRRGKGSRVTAVVPVTAGDTIYVFIGGNGRYGTGAGIGGYNGGGDAGVDGFGVGGGGGGATDIRIGGRDLAHRILIAAGGGGSSYDALNPSADLGGGDAGGLIGQAGFLNGASGPPGGGGGTQSAGGVGGHAVGYDSATAGVLGIGGSCPGSPSGGGGGGGGYYGGGGGSHAGGGAGSSYASTTATRHAVFHGPITSLIASAGISYTLPANSTPAVNAISPNGPVIYPNPSLSSGKLKFFLEQSASVKIRVLDVNGRCVWEESINQLKGEIKIELPSSNSLQGQYLVTIAADGRSLGLPLVWLKK